MCIKELLVFTLKDNCVIILYRNYHRNLWRYCAVKLIIDDIY